MGNVRDASAPGEEARGLAGGQGGIRTRGGCLMLASLGASAISFVASSTSERESTYSAGFLRRSRCFPACLPGACELADLHAPGEKVCALSGCLPVGTRTSVVATFSAVRESDRL